MFPEDPALNMRGCHRDKSRVYNVISVPIIKPRLLNATLTSAVRRRPEHVIALGSNVKST